MRAALVLVLFLVFPVAFAGSAGDTREIVADHVHPTNCPSYATPATVGCFDAPAGAAFAHIEAEPDVGNAQPRMLVWAYDDRNLTGTFWMCDDGRVPLGGATWLVVTLHPDREGCPPRPPVIVHGALRVTWT